MFPPSELPDADPTLPDADPTLPDADPTTPDADTTDADPTTPDADVTPTEASIRLVGSSSCTGPTTVITVPAAGLAVGSVAIVQSFRKNDSGSVSVTDSRGNSYGLVASAIESGSGVALLQAPITTALVAGDTITVTEPSTKPSTVIVSELRSASSTPFASVTGGVASNSISMGFTYGTPGVVYCGGGTVGGIVQLDPGWTQIRVLQDNCGGGQGDIAAFAFSLPAGQGGISSCNGSFSNGFDFELWVGAVVSYVE